VKQNRVGEIAKRRLRPPYRFAGRRRRGRSALDEEIRLSAILARLHLQGICRRSTRNREFHFFRLARNVAGFVSRTTRLKKPR
jgi:hypothetical protein